MLTTTVQLMHNLMHACAQLAQRYCVPIATYANYLEICTHPHTHILQKDSQEGARSFVFVSPGALRNPDKLMLLVQDDGLTRAGQWSRR